MQTLLFACGWFGTTGGLPLVRTRIDHPRRLFLRTRHGPWRLLAFLPVYHLRANACRLCGNACTVLQFMPLGLRWTFFIYNAGGWLAPGAAAAVFARLTPAFSAGSVLQTFKAGWGLVEQPAGRRMGRPVDGLATVGTV